MEYTLSAILSQIPNLHALNGLFRSGLDVLSHKVPIQIAMAKNWAG